MLKEDTFHRKEKQPTYTQQSSLLLITIVVVTMTLIAPGSAIADDVTDWNQYMFQAALIEKTSPVVMTRMAAIVQASARRAAAVQAAYATLIKLYPNETSTFDANRAASLAAIMQVEEPNSVALGVRWGQRVADAILEWRSTDGFSPAPPPFLGGTGVGEWRPTPPALLPGAVPQFAYMTPWVIQSPSQFRPAGPPELDSERYAQVFNEIKVMGSFSSPSRTAEQTLVSLFWNASTTSFYWHRVAIVLGATRHTSLSDNARVLAAVSVAMADAAIACWEAKYHYLFWRPVTANSSRGHGWQSGYNRGFDLDASNRHACSPGISFGSFHH
jgi:hypothetical protein